MKKSCLAPSSHACPWIDTKPWQGVLVRDCCKCHPVSKALDYFAVSSNRFSGPQHTCKQPKKGTQPSPGLKPRPCPPEFCSIPCCRHIRVLTALLYLQDSVSWTIASMPLIRMECKKRQMAVRLFIRVYGALRSPLQQEGSGADPSDVEFAMVPRADGQC